MGINVLSCFDGMSCGQIALNRIGVKIGKYYASEIDKYAIKATMNNFPNTIQLGDITKWREWDIDWSKIDLVIGGSPCQGFSFAGKQLAFDDPRSKLFFTFYDIIKHCKEQNPNMLYLLENVRMKYEHELVISGLLNTNPVIINSALVSAQNRLRLYWTNINQKPFGLFGDMEADIPQPKDKGILLKDILQPENEVDERYYLKESQLEWWNKNKEFQLKKQYSSLDGDKSITQTARQYASWNGSFVSGGNHSDMDLICVKNTGTNRVGSIGDGSSQGDRIYSPDGKSTAINAQSGGAGHNTGLYNIKHESDLLITHNMQPRMGKGQGGKGHLTKQDGKSYCCDTTNSNAVEFLNNNQLEKFNENINTEKSCCLTEAQGRAGSSSEYISQVSKIANITSNIRRLTPVECCRLQTVPDNYFKDKDGNNVISESQQYRCLGNGWTVDVISHIFGFLPSNFFNNN